MHAFVGTLHASVPPDFGSKNELEKNTHTPLDRKHN